MTPTALILLLCCLIVFLLCVGYSIYLFKRYYVCDLVTEEEKDNECPSVVNVQA